ncbi:MAG: TRAP transporter substrate-binding protein [Bradyrhizobium sp.]|uniref:TRAP transporter substrate-binding protein n=1 Tax=Bradyrhizobium sp. TaxID=376 RepID=UPI0025C73A7C|nr:TRAP transporter substrate-binding protein [Bradyrhizobium sp.]MBI5260742.1 TRAP transporter substrate-binding protein [Bradyrhizobium sp.]
MRRRITILLALAVAGLFLASPAPVLSQAAPTPLLLKGQSSHPAAANFHQIFKLWAEEVEKMSGGRLKIEVLPGGAIVPPFEVFDATSKGVLDVGMAPFGYIQGRNTATIPMSHGPLFGMDGQDYYAWYYDGGGTKLLDEFYRDVLKLNVVGFPIPTDYPQGLGWFKKPINSLADLKGLKYRIYGIGAETYGRLGVSVVTIPGQEIVPAMERGVIEGAEWINCLEDKKLGLHKVAKHYYTPGMHEPVTGGQLMINADVWKKLTPDLQEIVKVASVYATNMRNFAFNRETADACLELLKEGVQIHRTPDEILKNFLDEWEKIQAEYAAKNPFYQKVMDSQKKYAETVVPFRLSWWPPYDFAGLYYWKDKIYRKAAEAPAK